MPKYTKSKTDKIARKRIELLFALAKESFRQNRELANKHVKTARRIAMKHKIRLSPGLKRLFCRNCGSYLVQGVNARTRVHKHRLVRYCMDCKQYSRQPIR